MDESREYEVESILGKRIHKGSVSELDWWKEPHLIGISID